MKSQKDFRTNQTQSADTLRKAVKLEPIRKSGKERHEIYKGLNHADDDEEDYKSLTKRESILDYMGDDEEEDDIEYDDEDDEEYDDDDEENQA